MAENGAEEQPVKARVVIGLGSNLGDRSAHLATARRELEERGSFAFESCSSLYLSAPIGPDQPDYLNQVVIGSTSLTPRALLEVCGEIETQLGRDRTEVRWGPRTIDLDILCHGETQLALPDLVIPHPECTRRRFVLVPWAEIDPDGIVPGVIDEHGVPRTIAELLSSLERGGDRGMVERWEEARS